MTLSTTHIENSFTGNGSQTAFNFTFQVQSSSQVQVKLGGVIQTGGFTTVINSNQNLSPGGTVTFAVAPASMVAGNLKRVTTPTQVVGFTQESKVNTEKVELVLDKLMMLLQEASANTKGDQGEQGVPGVQGPPGEVGGPDTSINNALAVWNGVGGDALKNGPAPTNNGDTIVASGGQWVATAAAGSSIPSGLQAFWNTNVGPVPTGWQPMDGRTVTINGDPYVTEDTRGKYLMCGATDDTGSAGFIGATVRPGASGGTKTHTHTYSGGGSTGSTNPGSNTSINNGSSVLIGVKSNAGLSHVHSYSYTGTTAANAEASRPISIAELMIIKVDE